MPRAEIPEGVELWKIIDSGDIERGAVLTDDLPKLRQYWLEQFKEELLSDEAVEAFRRELLENSGNPNWPPHAPSVPSAVRTKRGLEAALASIPIEGEEGS